MSRRKITLSAPAPILTGSVVSLMAPCGKKNCRCHSDKDKQHGPYYRWTGVINGKRTSVALSPDVFEECKQRIKNYRLLLAELERAALLALNNPPWKSK